MKPTERRPRAGPLRRIAAVAAAGGGVGLLFVVLLVVGSERAAAAVLLLVPVAVLALARGGGGYIDRHVGRRALAHGLISVWASGMAAIVAPFERAAPPRLAAGVAALAVVVLGVENVVWARYPRELAAAGFGGDVDERRRSSGAALVVSCVAAQLAVTSLVVAGATEEAVTVGFGVVAAVYAAWAVVVMGAAVTRLRHGAAAMRPVIGAAVVEHAPVILVHFSGALRTMYQLDQWIPHLQAAGRPMLLVVREESTFEVVAGRWDVPVVFVGDFPDLDLVVPPSARLAVYVNTATKNNQLVRFTSLTHVQLHHGDSDKPPSSSKTMRLYDHHIVAGAAAYERLIGAGIVDGPDAVSIVGRPQTDSIRRRPIAEGRPCILYAPTWEGYHVDTALSSLPLSGYELVRSIPAHVDLLVRPHPLTGTVDGRLAGVVAAIRDAVAERGGEFIEPGEESLVDSINRADVLVTDISSVLVDFLATERPAVVIDVPGLGEDAFRARYPSAAWAAVVGADLAGLEAVLSDALGADTRRPLRAAARAEFLAHVGSAGERFAGAIRELISRSEVQAELVEP